ncbi:MAG: hypothetical protein PWP04_604 [Candidatus Atribacteria bacterium]|nr:hypothetical protein [Candidatus Atribacteria bacterium]
MTSLLLIKVGDRPKNALRVQEILSKYGCAIKTRLGIHEFSSECAEDDEGIIIIELAQKNEDIEKMVQELENLEKVKAIYQEL